ncbi:glycosyl hydrolase family 6 exoglucanase [Anaeromyces robustus]|uniref:Glucanase n=1 Tax=Anaeromyces robustus TaxID=1754192 RepID=A0A1Y1XBW7_9FUNG|nr:glycosyl hydrolase family 6 exoglucanase [Anaeromyces robustus]|eukprot:ORX83260.1 glycosyl hydrolase family 6 exoglucanase [Anaeromyces robustus]
MKTSVILTIIGAIAANVSATCDIEKKLGYPCCSNKNGKVVYKDENGNWGVEHHQWCIFSDNTDETKCWSNELGYPCCKSTTEIVFTDDRGNWGVEDKKWCGVIVDETKPVEEVKNVWTSNNVNPFAESELYVDPNYQQELDNLSSTIKDPTVIEKVEKMKQYSTGIWLDSIQSVNELLESNLDNAYAQQVESGKNVLTTFVLYNLPGRDCHAITTNGELLAKDSDLERYKHEYIDVIEEIIKKHNNQPIAFVVEPTSLPSIATFKKSTPACADTEKYYLEGHSYLIKKLGVLPNVFLYLDVGHAFWLGWDDLREETAKLYAKVIQSGAPGIVRGFADNISNYVPWDDANLTNGPNTEYNPYPDSKRYIESLRKDFVSVGIKNVNFISDTSLTTINNGSSPVEDWCYNAPLGIGARPQANPVSDMSYLDAFVWIKPFYGDKPYDSLCLEERLNTKRLFEKSVKNANPPL